MLKISALSGKNVHKLRPLLQESIAQYQTRVPTRDINKVLADAQQRQPAGEGGQGAVRRAGGDRSADVHLFVNKEIPQPYLRYLERSIREAFDLGSTAMKLRVRKRE